MYDRLKGICNSRINYFEKYYTIKTTQQKIDMATGSISDAESLVMIRDLFLENGWTLKTAVCCLLFTLVHWPCSTTVLTVKKESGSLKWTAASILTPAVCGFTICFAAARIMELFGL